MENNSDKCVELYKGIKSTVLSAEDSETGRQKEVLFYTSTTEGFSNYLKSLLDRRLRKSISGDATRRICSEHCLNILSNKMMSGNFLGYSKSLYSTDILEMMCSIDKTNHVDRKAGMEITQDLGDLALVLTGIFYDYISNNRRKSRRTIDEYVSVGRQSYYISSGYADNLRDSMRLQTISGEFENLKKVFNEIKREFFDAGIIRQRDEKAKVLEFRAN